MQTAMATLRLLLLSFSLFLLIGCASAGGSPAMMVGLSDDGRHVVSSHRDSSLVLWDIENREYSVVSTDANIYSAYFVPGSDEFVWQDLSGAVYRGSVGSSDRHRMFDSIAETYGHVFEPHRELYLYSDVRWRIKSGDGRKLKWDGDSPSVLGTGKLLNMELSPAGDRLLSVGSPLAKSDKKPMKGQSAVSLDQRFSNFSGLVVWDIDRFEPIARMVGHNVKTHATFSPDGNYVVSVDENGKAFVWDAHTGAMVDRLARPGGGVWIGDDHPDPISAPKEEVYDYGGIHLEWPDDFPEDFSVRSIVAVRFVSDSEFMVIYTYSHYATLYQLGDPHARKVLDLGTRPHPSTGAYLRNASIASAPEAGILVTGQQSGNGINVYRFDEETKELEKVWTPRR